MCTLLLVTTRENQLEYVSAASLALYMVNLYTVYMANYMVNFSRASEKDVVPKFTIESAGHYIRYANIKVFSQPYFPVCKQNPRTYTGK